MGFRDVFPDNSSFVVCLAYMGAFVLQGILTRSSQVNGKYEYNTTTGVMVAETIKLGTAISLYLKDHSVDEFVREFQANKRLMGLYFVPAFLYCIYNNLTFTNLANYDPTSYYLLLQFRVVVTGVVFQFLFNKQLSQKQWGSLVLLTMGCLLKEYGSRHKATEKGVEGDMWNFYFHTVLILVQVFCSCFAGVYNERLLKNEGHNVHLMMQNTFMYLDSIVSNLIFLTAKGEIGVVLSGSNLSAMMRFVVIAVCVNNAAIGIITSLFLKKLNSVVKVYASAVELLLTAYLSWFLFNIPVDFYTFVSLSLIISASYVYTMNPVVSQPAGLPK
eukprot:comp20069_c0_seq1/m.24690 comp20069_c0_seq1/g.24690  ORF comp20069_c0_seq1/g.24690 comp20069_c0_seq1/m.24690 type:complete len:330 (-) comp20069_c0_seq1:743-1732(-)